MNLFRMRLSAYSQFFSFIGNTAFSCKKVKISCFIPWLSSFDFQGGFKREISYMHLFNHAFKNIALIRTMAFYAVARGRQAGIYDTWAKCEEQVKGFANARYKKFPTRQEAQHFIDTNSQTSSGFSQKRKIAEKQKEEFWPSSKVCKTDSQDLNDLELLNVAVEAEKKVKPSTSKKHDSAANSNKRYIPNDNVFRHKSKIWHPVDTVEIGGHKFHLDEEGFVICYTDGSCVNNGKRGAYAGFGVYFADDNALNAAKPVTGRATNNVGEIQAAIYAIQCALKVGIPKICVSTDSQFLLNSAISWITSWKQKNWKLQDGSPVKNATEFKELDKLLQNPAIIVKWNYVKAHVGIKGNEMADQLAKTGAELYKLKKHNVFFP